MFYQKLSWGFVYVMSVIVNCRIFYLDKGNLFSVITRRVILRFSPKHKLLLL